MHPHGPVPLLRVLQVDLKVPLVVRLEGTNVETGKKILTVRGSAVHLGAAAHPQPPRACWYTSVAFAVGLSSELWGHALSTAPVPVGVTCGRRAASLSSRQRTWTMQLSRRSRL